MNTSKKAVKVLVSIMIVAIGLSGCEAMPWSMGAQEEIEEVEIGYVTWVCATASTYLVKNILENEMNVRVTTRDLEPGVMWQSLGTGDIDFIVSAWLPGTHATYWEQVEGEVEDLGPNYEGARIGLVVPEYVEINSIPELPTAAQEFDNRIVGIDPGAGIMEASREALEIYDLDLELVESSDAAMTAELSRAVNSEEWIVVTGWTPHWKFSDFDLKFLEDPEGVYGEEETINTITRQGFAEEHPEIQTFLENFFLTDEQLGSLIGKVEAEDNADRAAEKWLEENPGVLEDWIN